MRTYMTCVCVYTRRRIFETRDGRCVKKLHVLSDSVEPIVPL